MKKLYPYGNEELAICEEIYQEPVNSGFYGWFLPSPLDGTDIQAETDKASKSGDIGCGSGDEFTIFPPSGRVEDKQTKIFRLSLCQTSSYNTTSVGLAYFHVNTSSSPRKCVAAYRLEKYLEAQFIDMKIVEILRLAKER
ncbi:hypothetical protein F2Q70_00015885 [Brassica cretica]|uniref:Uncharacterized protein n=1 Tax=Brassica cretica TaxID=69181 RepID=A0A8S9HX55_BRACR|nr:hypothetical protein F2Q70_00015885 [Brassica cretica]